jgi:hypothetical protein
LGVAVLKSATVLSLSAQPSLILRAAVVGVGAGKFALPSTQVDGP